MHCKCQMYAKDKPKKHCQERPTKIETHLRRGTGIAAFDKQENRRSVVQCVHIDASWIKVEVMVKFLQYT